ncbi:MAG: macrolide ABC transporter ATP-binding protein [Chloroflexi bacterium]|nr:macrolide ABC transporter ATP-binding protein [Chloroflexota bacterium]
MILGIIEISNLRKSYTLGTLQVPALNGVDLSVERGEMVSIMGASGSGKSTLLNIIGCLDVPTEGTYSLDGEEISGLNDDSLASLRGSKIGFVFQNYNLLPRLSALSNVELALLYRKSSYVKDRSMAALDSVGLGHRYSHRPMELSGGEQQRVAIARALVKEPVMLLADEPTGALDTRSSTEIMAILQRLNKEMGLTVIIVTHENDVALYTQRIISFSDGRIVQDAPVERQVILSAEGEK